MLGKYNPRKAVFACIVLSLIFAAKYWWGFFTVEEPYIKVQEEMIRYCRERGIQEIMGSVLCDNKRMLSLADELGFARVRTLDDTYELSLAL